MSNTEREAGENNTREWGDEGCQPETLSPKTVAKIAEFASNHTSENVERLRNDLVRVLLEIVSYCCSGKVCEFSPVTVPRVDVGVVLTIEERLSVRVKMGDAEAKHLFRREDPKDKVESRFLRLLDGCAFLAAEGTADK